MVLAIPPQPKLLVIRGLKINMKLAEPWPSRGPRWVGTAHPTVFGQSFCSANNPEDNRTGA